MRDQSISISIICLLSLLFVACQEINLAGAELIIGVTAMHRHFLLGGVVLLLSPIMPKALPICHSAPQSVGPPASVVGTYSWSSGFAGCGATLLKNGRFAAGCGGDLIDSKTGSAGSEIHGRYIVKDDVVTLKPEYSCYTTTKRPYPRMRFRWTAGTIPMRLVPWSGRVYLLHLDSGELDLCNAINLGEEPHFARFGAGTPLLLRNGDEKKPVSGWPRLPDRWRSYLLPQPITCTVTKIASKKTADIDKGQAEGLKQGMALADLDSRYAYELYHIVSLREHSATIRPDSNWVFTIKPGARLSTRLSDAAHSPTPTDSENDDVIILH
jgi:hypothetical protein